jgi:carboxypeptidase Q
MMYSKSSRLILLLLIPITLLAQREKIDTDMMKRIRDEGMKNSQIPDIAFHLTDAGGPRLTSSPGFFKAANYAKDQLAKWGLVNSMLDPWGDFGKSWELQKSYIAMTSPWYKSLIAIPKTWTASTNGLATGDVMLVNVKDSTDIYKYKGRLGGKIIMMERNDSYKYSFEADAKRYTDAELDSMANIKPAAPKAEPDSAAIKRRQEQMKNFMEQRKLATQLKAMAMQEGAVAMFTSSPRNHDGTVFVQQAGPYRVTDPANFLDIAVSYEDYMTIQRLVKNNIPVKIEMDVKSRFTSDDTKGYNVIAEIPGTDKNLKDEVVMLGGHLDSWHGGTGATDNGAGCMVMMEAVRILKTLGIKPRRTIRIALWSGEEQGILGSAGYVKKTFADPADMKLLPAHQKFDAYYNIDNGTGKIRGIYLQGNQAAGEIFRQWFTPFNDLGAKTITISNTGGTDHLSFDAVGLPGFQFIQDELEYDSRNHHSNMDVYDHLSFDDLKQVATIVAAFVYNTAQRDEKIPRKELPKPKPPRPFGM